MKKNYIYLIILLLVTIALTFLFSFIYKNKVVETSYLYENLNKITSEEFEEYMIEHPDTIIYISEKTNLDNNKFEKKLIKKLEKHNLIENTVYIDKEEINASIEQKLLKEYSYKYNSNNLPVIIMIDNGKVIQSSIIDKNVSVDTIIDYEVFE